MNPVEQLAAVREMAIEHRVRIERCYREELLPALADHAANLDVEAASAFYSTALQRSWSGFQPKSSPQNL